MILFLDSGGHCVLHNVCTPTRNTVDLSGAPEPEHQS